MNEPVMDDAVRNEPVRNDAARAAAVRNDAVTKAAVRNDAVRTAAVRNGAVRNGAVRNGAVMRADAGKGLGQVVVAVLELLRDLLERQALRRMAAGELSAEEVERLGRALLDLSRQFAEIRAALGVTDATDLRLPIDLADLLEE